MAILSDNARLNVQAALVLVITVVAVVLVPHETLRPIALAVLGASGLGLFGTRAYMRRLERAIDFLAAAGTATRADGLVALLTGPERTVLRVGEVTDVRASIDLLRARQRSILSAGMLVGLIAISAGLAAIVAFDL